MTAALELLPAESMSLTVAAAHVRRGEVPPDNVSFMCVLALLRLTGRHDWTHDPEDTDG